MSGAHVWPAVVCAWRGVPGDCGECGGWDHTGSGWCGYDCRAAYEDRGARHAAQGQARREAEDAFARECERLRTLGHNDREIDALLAGMP